MTKSINGVSVNVTNVATLSNGVTMSKPGSLYTLSFRDKETYVYMNTGNFLDDWGDEGNDYQIRAWNIFCNLDSLNWNKDMIYIYDTDNEFMDIFMEISWNGTKWVRTQIVDETPTTTNAQYIDTEMYLSFLVMLQLGM